MLEAELLSGSRLDSRTYGSNVVAFIQTKRKALEVSWSHTVVKYNRHIGDRLLSYTIIWG